MLRARVPEAAVDEHRDPRPTKQDVDATTTVPTRNRPVDDEPQAPPMKSTAQSEFRAGTGSPGPLHHPPGGRRRCRWDQAGVEVLVHGTSISSRTDTSRRYGSPVRSEIAALGRPTARLRTNEPVNQLIERSRAVWLVRKSSDTVLPHADQGRRDRRSARRDRPLCRGERPVEPSADDHRRLGPQPGDDLFGGARARRRDWPAPSEMRRLPSRGRNTSSRTYRLRGRPGSGPGAVVAVAAAVPGTVVDPVRVHPPPAQPAPHQPGEHIPANRAVVVPRAARTLLDSHEVRFAHQRRMRRAGRSPTRPGPSAVPAPGALRGGSTPAGPYSAGWPRSPPPTAGSTPARCGADSAPGRQPTGTAHRARSTPARCPATLRPASRSAKIHRTCGAVTGSGSSRCSRRPHAACARFGCGPASTSRYPYGGRPPRNRPCSTACARIAAIVRCRDRTTSRCDCAASTCINTRCVGSSSRTGPPASGSHTSHPVPRQQPGDLLELAPVNARSYSPTTTASNRTIRSPGPLQQRRRLRTPVPRHPPRAADVEELRHDHPVPGDQRRGHLPLPRPRRHRVLELRRRHPPVEREPHTRPDTPAVQPRAAAVLARRPSSKNIPIIDLNSASIAPSELLHRAAGGFPLVTWRHRQ